MSDSSAPRTFDRRGFLQLVAGAVTALPAVAAAQTPPAPAPTAAPADTSAAKPPEHSGSEARLLTEVLRARYPDRFTDAQWVTITGDIDGRLAGGKRLRAVKLANGDEPDTIFHP